MEAKQSGHPKQLDRDEIEQLRREVRRELGIAEQAAKEAKEKLLQLVDGGDPQLVWIDWTGEPIGKSMAALLAPVIYDAHLLELALLGATRKDGGDPDAPLP